MCVSALVLGLSTGFDAEAKVKKARVKKIAKTERVAKSVDKDCDKAKAECKDAKACENKKAECKDAKACKDMKAECKDAKPCDKAQMKDNKKQLFGNAKIARRKTKTTSALTRILAARKALARRTLAVVRKNAKLIPKHAANNLSSL